MIMNYKYDIYDAIIKVLYFSVSYILLKVEIIYLAQKYFSFLIFSILTETILCLFLSFCDACYNCASILSLNNKLVFN